MLLSFVKKDAARLQNVSLCGTVSALVQNTLGKYPFLLLFSLSSLSFLYLSTSLNAQRPILKLLSLESHAYPEISLSIATSRPYPSLFTPEENPRTPNFYISERGMGIQDQTYRSTTDTRFASEKDASPYSHFSELKVHRQAPMPPSLDLVWLLDSSLSLAKKQYSKALAFSEDFIHSLRREDTMALYTTEEKPLLVSEFRSEAKQLSQVLKNIEHSSQYTRLYDALYSSIYLAESLRLSKPQETQDLRPAVILLSDGREEDSLLTDDDCYRLSITGERLSIPIYIIILQGKDTQVPDAKQLGQLKRLAIKTGGYFWIITEKSDTKESLREIWGRLLASKEFVYKLSYTSKPLLKELSLFKSHPTTVTLGIQDFAYATHSSYTVPNTFILRSFWKKLFGHPQGLEVSQGTQAPLGLVPGNDEQAKLSSGNRSASFLANKHLILLATLLLFLFLLFLILMLRMRKRLKQQTKYLENTDETLYYIQRKLAQFSLGQKQALEELSTAPKQEAPPTTPLSSFSSEHKTPPPKPVGPQPNLEEPTPSYPEAASLAPVQQPKTQIPYDTSSYSFSDLLPYGPGGLMDDERSLYMREYSYRTLQLALKDAISYRRAALETLFRYPSGTVEGMGDLPVKKRVYDLFLADTLIGTGRWAHIPIRDMRASLVHARIKKIDQCFVLYDLMTASGIYLNGQKLLRPKALRNADEIRIGGQSFRFVGQK